MKKVLAAMGLLLLLQAPVQAQFLKSIFINRYDRHNMHHGKWKYRDLSNKRHLICVGWFDHGKQVKEWKYYYPDGKLRFIENYSWVGDMRVVDVIYFHENGHVSNKGIAMVDSNEGKTHYYWEGDWNYFEEDGTFIKTVTYNNGQPIKSTYANGRVEIEQTKLPHREVTIPIHQ